MAEKVAGGESVSPPEAAKVRVVRCPKCGKLLPELAGFKVYRCGGCNATLQAKRKISTKAVSPEISTDGSMRKPEAAAVTPHGKNKVHSSESQAVVPDSNIGVSSENNGVFLDRAADNGSPASGTDSNDYKVVSDEDGTIKSDYPGEESKKRFGDDIYQHAPKSPVYHFNLDESDDSKVLSKADGSTTCDNSAKETPIAYKRESKSPVQHCNPKLNEWDESKVFPEVEDTRSGAYPAEESQMRYKNGHYLHATNVPDYHSYLNELDESKVLAIVDDTMSASPTEKSHMEYRDSRHQRASKAPVYYSNYIEENHIETRDNQYPRTSKPPAYDASSDVVKMPRMHSNKKGHNNLQDYDLKKVQAEPVSRNEDKAMGSLLTLRGSSQGRFTNHERGMPFGLSDSMYSRHQHQDPDGVEHIEQDTTELLKTLNGIRDQLSRPYESPIKGKPSEVALSSNMPVPKNPSTTNSSEFLYETSSPLSQTSHHSIHKRGLDNPGLITQDSVRGYGETFESQAMQYQNPSQHLQRQSTNFSYEQFNRNPRRLQTREASYHQPSCPCRHCSSSHMQMLSHGPPTDFRSRGRSYVSKNSNFGSGDEHLILQLGNSGINSTLGSYQRYLNKSISRNVHVRRCRPLAGGSPLIMCHNCFELLQLPHELLSNGMHQKRLECGSCSQVITFKIAGKRLIVYSPTANVADSTGCSNPINKTAGNPSVEFDVNPDPAASQYRSHGSSSSNVPPVDGSRSRPSPTNPTHDAMMEDHSIKLEKMESVSPSKVYKDEYFSLAQFCKNDLSDSSRKSRVDTFMHYYPSNERIKSPQSDLALSPEVGSLHSPSSPTPNAVVEEHYPDLSESEKMEGDSPTSKMSEEVVLNVRSYEKDVSYSPSFSSKSGVVISTHNLPSNEHNLSPSAEVCSISNCFEEKISINKKNSAENNRSVLGKKKSPISDHSNSEISQYTSEVPNEEYNHKFSKGGNSFITGIMKKSLFRSSQPLEKGKANVSVNGHLIPDRLVKKAEKIAGVIQPGEYWYDYQAGFWGVIGQPCLGIIPPHIEEFNYPMAKKCSAGNTDVVVNGRELHSGDLTLLAARGLPMTSGRSYIVEISGAFRDASTGVELGALGKLAPTIEKLRKGFGMRPPRVAAV